MASPSLIEIKKYANRRLYDTAQSAYITLADLAKMVATGKAVKISDAKSGEDLTATTLLQILAERHNPAHSVLSASLLARIIAHDQAEDGLALRAHLDEALASFEASQMADETDLAEMKRALLRLNAAFSRFER